MNFKKTSLKQKVWQNILKSPRQWYSICLNLYSCVHNEFQSLPIFRHFLDYIGRPTARRIASPLRCLCSTGWMILVSLCFLSHTYHFYGFVYFELLEQIWSTVEPCYLERQCVEFHSLKALLLFFSVLYEIECFSMLKLFHRLNWLFIL